MMTGYIFTLVSSSDNLSFDHVEAVHLHDFQTDGALNWLSPNKAFEIALSTKPSKVQIDSLRTALNPDKIDVFVTSAENRRKKLLLADMDSTIVTGETLDDMAARAGCGEEIAAITARSMRGELDFEQALRERVAMLKGKPESLMHETLAQDVHLSSGAETLVRTMVENGMTCILVSGGFTFFTGAVAEQCGFHCHHGNILEIENAQIAGTVGDPILNRDAKKTFLLQYMDDLGLSSAETLTIGDGANDLAMLQAAGLGIGHHPKPVVQESLDNVILHTDLTSVLYAQGYRDEEFVS